MSRESFGSLSSTMAAGKNKHTAKGGKKVAKKKAVSPFSKKQLNDEEVGASFKERTTGKIPVTSTQVTSVPWDGLRGHVLE